MNLINLFVSFDMEGGSGYCKFGWNKCSAPSGRSATFLVRRLFIMITLKKFLDLFGKEDRVELWYI